jgi:hypothetical protein
MESTFVVVEVEGQRAQNLAVKGTSFPAVEVKFRILTSEGEAPLSIVATHGQHGEAVRVAPPTLNHQPRHGTQRILKGIPGSSI